jgi:hypothetical protein
MVKPDVHVLKYYKRLGMKINFISRNQIMEELFVPYKIAVLLKEKGFDQEGLGFCYFYHRNSAKYNLHHAETLDNDHNCQQYDMQNFVIAPLYQEAVDWLRNKHNIHLWVNSPRKDPSEGKVYDHYEFEWNIVSGHPYEEVNTKYESYYEALLSGLELAIKEIK